MNITTPQKVILSIAVLANCFVIVVLLEDGFGEIFLPAVFVNFILYVLYKIWGKPKN